MNTQEFGIADILTQTSGRLLTPIGDVYKFLEWVSGEDGLMTHQLPRVSREVEPFLREQFPDLAAIDIADVPIKTYKDVDALLARLTPEHGATRRVPQMPEVDHTRIDPLQELRMLRPDAPIIAIDTGDAS